MPWIAGSVRFKFIIAESRAVTVSESQADSDSELTWTMTLTAGRRANLPDGTIMTR